VVVVAGTVTVVAGTVTVVAGAVTVVAGAVTVVAETVVIVAMSPGSRGTPDVELVRVEEGTVSVSEGEVEEVTVDDGPSSNPEGSAHPVSTARSATAATNVMPAVRLRLMQSIFLSIPIRNASVEDSLYVAAHNAGYGRPDRSARERSYGWLWLGVAGQQLGRVSKGTPTLRSYPHLKLAVG
jgi:hypothetical protein